MAVPNNRTWLIPEFIQNSAMDSGPVALKALCAGLKIDVGLGRLRRLSQTEVDGTDLEDLSHLAARYGVFLQQEYLPLDFLFLDPGDTGPMILKARSGGETNHFCVYWGALGPRLQIMDTIRGRFWPDRDTFRENLREEERLIDAEAWRTWAGDVDFLLALERCQETLGVPQPVREKLRQRVLGQPDWFYLATLEAVTRLVLSFCECGALRRGDAAAQALVRLFQTCLDQRDKALELVPRRFWSVVAGPADTQGRARLRQRGILVLRLVDVQTVAEPATADGQPKKPMPTPFRYLLNLMLADGWFLPSLYLIALAVMAVGTIVEALLFRGLLDMGLHLTSGQRFLGISMVLLFLITQLVLQFLVTQVRLRIGGKIESRLRMAFLAKLPRLGRNYLSTLSLGDISERCHSVTDIRQISSVLSRIINNGFGLLLTTAGLIWLDPDVAVPAIVGTLLFLALPPLLAPYLAVPDMRNRTHGGSLTTYYLDALQGLIACRSLGAEGAVSREHDRLLGEWTRSGRALQWRSVWFEGLTTLAGFALAAGLVFLHVQKDSQAGSVLLFAYWALRVPVVGETLIGGIRGYPGIRNRTLRLMDAIFAAEENLVEPTEATREPDGDARNEPGVAVSFHGVSVKASGQTILKDVYVNLARGEHVALVGPSGAGKSTLAGLLLGTVQPRQGRVLVEGKHLDSEQLEMLRQTTAWVSPEVHLWNRTLLENLQYGSDESVRLSLAEVFEKSMLYDVLEGLPQGLQTVLGEEGTFISGGEGARVRLGRGMMRPLARLVILDEPFRGLDRHSRRRLLRAVRQWWPRATLLFITHDVREAMSFNRVLVMRDGALAEDGKPGVLLQNPDSHLSQLIQAEEWLDREIWHAKAWRREYLEKGMLLDPAAAPGRGGR